MGALKNKTEPWPVDDGVSILSSPFKHLGGGKPPLCLFVSVL